jgi:preprotein translocase subunit YajC
MSTETLKAHTTETTQVTPETMPDAPSQGMEFTFVSFIPYILMFAVFYFIVIRPSERKRKEQENFINSVKRNEEVLTVGGIIGKVVKINETDSTILLEIAENTTIKVMKSAITDIIGRKSTEVKPLETKEEKKEEVKEKSKKKLHGSL